MKLAAERMRSQEVEHRRLVVDAASVRVVAVGPTQVVDEAEAARSHRVLGAQRRIAGLRKVGALARGRVGSGAELDLFECGICAGVMTDTTAEGYADDYLRTGGTLELTAIGTAVGQTLTGRLSNLTFQRMTVAEDGSTTPDGDCTTMLTAATFTATLMMDPGGGKAR